MHLIRKYFTLLAALTAIAAFAAGCGDDEKNDAADTASQAQTEAETAAEEATEGAIDEATLREFIDAANEDPAILCDPENATAEFLEGVGGEEACAEAAAAEEPGGEYEISDVNIDGDTATLTITDDDGPSTATFVQEGEELKYAGE